MSRIINIECLFYQIHVIIFAFIYDYNNCHKNCNISVIHCTSVSSYHFSLRQGTLVFGNIHRNDPLFIIILIIPGICYWSFVQMPRWMRLVDWVSESLIHSYFLNIYRFANLSSTNWSFEHFFFRFAAYRATCSWVKPYL